MHIQYIESTSGHTRNIIKITKTHIYIGMASLQNSRTSLNKHSVNKWFTLCKPAYNLDLLAFIKQNKGNAKRGVSPRLKIWPCDLDLWPMTLKINRVPNSTSLDWWLHFLCITFGHWFRAWQNNFINDPKL